MTRYTPPIEDFNFLLRRFLPLEGCDLPSLQALDAETMEAVLEEGARFCETVLHPLNGPGDLEGCRFADGQVSTPAGFREAYQTYCEAGWPGLTSSPDYGGQGLPYVLGLAMAEMITASNTSWGMYPALSHGAWEALNRHGSQEQKDLYLPKMISGEWTGTMNLTESHCGTDLGLIRTRAEPVDDGSYRISGTKIWISAGEHDMADNIIHMVLARLPDAPEGTRGISLFIVPKFLVNEDSSLGDRNGVRCGGIDHKMGIKASATCEMIYDNATGYLVGEAHRGLAYMFTMMNAARLETGIQGLGLASVAYQNAAEFARERLQGRSLDGAKQPDKPADPIIVHPDVRRMLMTSRAFIEGARAIGLYTALQLETQLSHPDEAAREKAGHWVALMTPIIKAWFTDMGFEVTSLGVQVHGGAGYIVDTGVEQFMRDARITRIYEGTNGIQALDLVGRKLVADSGKTIQSFFETAGALVAEASGEEAMNEFIEPLSQALERLKNTTAWVYQQMASNPLEAGAASVDYLNQFALTAMAWSWAGQARIALSGIEDGTGNERFLRTKLDTARFFMQRMLPDTVSLDQKIRAGAAPIMALDAETF
ncbi:acyl-CoA dehydrogenase C-terminal domain-containing protein [Wenzhouxiangella sp. AB-CW3]|uniref:acyl-CoA dehydrogenase C-terminal domain-containing protein n=1 Tax=Wenzhouxiangella sp. AB-CW3 TaxID=2771012 RepID=UPI00168B4EC5|nr:acyl-CoA dehydrogenase C-terminal domain-containing protein [Wenzhouxiangella sp. AB-CW3]QOC23888.1 acyl-CoA dehydrogenase C-terminal domain-containing protein [Wenzhouxiangella sp. AB-CW3]